MEVSLVCGCLPLSAYPLHISMKYKSGFKKYCTSQFQKLHFFLIKAVNKGGRGCQSRPSFLVLNFWAHFLIKAVNKGGCGCQSRWIRVPRPAGEDSSSRIRGHFPSLSFRQTDVNVIILSFRFSSFGIAPWLRNGLVRLREPSGAQLWLFTFNI